MRQKLILSFSLVVLMLSFIGLLNAIDVSTVLDLWNVRNNLGGTYTQTASIDLSRTDPDIIPDWLSHTTYSVGDIRKYTDGFAYYCIQAQPSSGETYGPSNPLYWTKMWEASKGWKPIGSGPTEPFYGIYDGGNHQIRNLYINRGPTTANGDPTWPYWSDGEDNIGLFGFVTNASGTGVATTYDVYVRNVNMINPRVTGRRATGALIGKVLLPVTKPARSYTVYTENCSSQVLAPFPSGANADSIHVRGFGATGGIVGANNSDGKQRIPVIRRSWSNVNVSSVSPNKTWLNPNDYYGSPRVYNPYNIKYGGVVGCNENGITMDSYARGDISGGDRVGGVAGCTIGGAIYRSYATGDITQGISGIGEGGFGGLVGRSDGSLPPGLGGTGEPGSVEYGYWLVKNPDPGYTNTYTASRTEAQFQATDSTGTNFPTWDFTNVWGYETGTNDDYPILRSSASANTYFRSQATGNWGTIATWQSSTDNVNWVNATVAPDAYNSLAITVRSPDVVTVNSADYVIDQTTVDSGGKIMVATGRTLTVIDGLGTDLSVAGTLEHDGTLTLGVSSSTTVSGTLLTDGTLNLFGDLTVSGTHTIASGATTTYATNSKKVFSGTVAQNAGAAFPTDVWDLEINNTAGVTFPNGFDVNSVLYLINGSYTITSGSVNVNGYTSPTVTYFEMKKLNVLTDGFAITTNTDQADPDYIDRQWALTGNINDTSSIERTKELTFYWNASEDGNNVWGAVYPYVYAGTTPIVPHSRSLDTNPRWVKIFYTFPQSAKATEDFKIGLGDDQTLPVELSSFTASMHMGQMVQLLWITQSETNLSGYRIYRGRTELITEAILLDAFIEGSNTSQSQTYAFTDTEIWETGTYYYWLESVDLDGSVMLFGPVQVYFEPGGQETPGLPVVAGIDNVYPNPFNPTTTIRYGVENASAVSVEIYNMRGQLVRSFAEGIKSAGYHQIVWDGRADDGRNLGGGIYFLRLTNDGKRYSQKLVLLK